MKCTSRLLLIAAFTGTVFYQTPVNAGWSSVAKAISTGVEIAGHVATAVDVAMNIANVGVTLWGSEKDRERMAKGLGITSIITSIARGDFETAQAQAENMRGGKADIPQYTPLTGDALVDADIVPVQPTTTRTTRAFGDVTKVDNTWIENLRKSKKIITIDDMKLAQFGILKNQLVFAARLPQNAGEQKLYQLMNGVEVMFQAFTDVDAAWMPIPDKLKIICYRISTEGDKITKKEFVSISLPKSELQKDFFFGTNDNQLSLFNREGNDIVKTVLIQKMVE